VVVGVPIKILCSGSINRVFSDSRLGSTQANCERPRVRLAASPQAKVFFGGGCVILRDDELNFLNSLILLRSESTGELWPGAVSSQNDYVPAFLRW